MMEEHGALLTTYHDWAGSPLALDLQANVSDGFTVSIFR
jgi:hypothetical protein